MSNADDKDTKLTPEEERQRVYQVSANRGRSRHKLRYVESSVADNGDCRLCVGALSPDEQELEPNEKTNKEDTDNS